MTRNTLILILAVVFATGGITYAVVQSRSHSDPTCLETDEHACETAHSEAGHSEDEHAGSDIPGLELALAVAGEGWDVVSATGQIVVPPHKYVKISPRIEGKVVEARGNIGDTVRRGQVLAVISSVELAEARADHRRASARLNAARTNLEQEQKMAALGANSVRPLEEARAERLDAQMALSEAKSERVEADSRLSQAQSELERCKARLQRARELYADKIVSKQDLESAEAEFRRDTASVDAARAGVNRADAQVTKAVANLQIAEQYLDREEAVYEGGVIDTRAIQAAKAGVTAATIDVQAAADRIRVLGASPGGSGDTVAIASSVDGRIVARSTNVGQMASPSDELFAVADLSEVWIEADIYEKDLARIKTGLPVEIRVDAYPDRVFSGKVNSVGDLLSIDSRTAKIRCLISNDEALLRGGMFAKIDVVTAKRGRAVLIPKKAVLDEAGKKTVFTPCLECPEDKEARTNACGAYDELEVVTGPAHGDNIEVLSGIEPGTRVVTTGNYQLKTALGAGELEAGCSH